MGDKAAQKRWYEKKKQDPAFVEKRRQAGRENYEKNSERMKAAALKYHFDNHEEQKEKARARAKKNRPAMYRRKEIYFAQSIGLTIEQFDAAKAKIACDICENLFTDTKHKHIDHCHETMRYRGTLCSACNLMLGHAKDNLKTLAKAIVYLNEKEPANV